MLRLPQEDVVGVTMALLIVLASSLLIGVVYLSQIVANQAAIIHAIMEGR